MRKVLSLVSALILLALIVAILRSTPETDAGGVTVASTNASTVAETTDTSTASNPSTSTSVRSTDSTTARTVEDETGLRAEFVLSEVVFGSNGYVAITNVGGATGDLDGFALCQRPSYFVMPSVSVDPFQVVWVALGDGSGLTNSSVVSIIPANGGLGRVEAGDGEMALYRSSQFSASDEMRSYVEWGSSGHGRSNVAIEAGLWDPDVFIEIPDDTFGVSSTSAEPQSPNDWVASIGG